MQGREASARNPVLRLKRFTAVHSNYGQSDYENLWEDFDREFSEEDEDDPHSVVLLCVFLTLLSVIFLASVTINVSILLVFTRKHTLRTTSNRWAQAVGSNNTLWKLYCTVLYAKGSKMTK